MGNHAYATARGSEPGAFWDAFSLAVSEAATARFGSVALVHYPSDSEASVNLIDPGTGQICACSAFWSRGDDGVEWSHRPDALDWWLQETLAAAGSRQAADALGVTVVITDDGVEEEMAPGFDLRYPL